MSTQDVTHAVRFSTTVRGGLAHVAITYKGPGDGFWRHGGDLLVPPSIAEVLNRVVELSGSYDAEREG